MLARAGKQSAPPRPWCVATCLPYTCSLFSNPKTSGIKRDGPSYLLLPCSQWPAWAERSHGALEMPYVPKYGRPETVDDYISFSPITFTDSEQLEKKLKSYQVKKQQDPDSSAANRQHRDGRPRAAFEHSRCVSRCSSPCSTSFARFGTP